MKSSRNKVVIITGGRSRVGRLLARSLATVGARLLIAEHPACTDQGEALPASGEHVELLDLDVTSASDVERMVGLCEQRFGRVDLLINNTTSPSALRDIPFAELTVDDWHQAMNVNMLGPFLSCRAVLPTMIRGGGGQIINIVSSMSGSSNPQPLHQQAGSGALLAMTRSLASEFEPHGIWVNTVAAGFASSFGPGVGFPENQQPTDVLDAVAFLSQAGNRSYTGRTINVAKLVSEDSLLREREHNLAQHTSRQVPSSDSLTA